MRRLSALQATALAAMTLAGAACTGVIGGESAAGVAPARSGSANAIPSSGAGAGSGAASGVVVEDAGGAEGSAPTSGAPSSPTLALLFGGTVDASAAGPLALRHLTQSEYLNTVSDLFGSAAIGSAKVTLDAVPAEPPTQTGFPVPGQVDDTTATAYQFLAESIASTVLANVATLVPCTPASGSGAPSTNAACTEAFLAKFGAKLYRRPLSTTEVSSLMALYNTGLSTLNLDFYGAIDLLIEEMLQSPGFLYHWEVGPGPTTYSGAEVQLDGYAIANRLSYFLWGTMPDDTLFAAAAANQLSTSDQVAMQASRMLGDPRARLAVENFFEQWLGIDQLGQQPKDGTVYPNWNATLASEMDAEFRSFVDSVIFDRSGALSELFTSTTTSVNGDLALVYGVTASGSSPQAVTLNRDQRAGLLTTAAWLTRNGDPATSNPVYRGHSVYVQLLCGVVPPPPPNVPPPAPASSGGTTRDRFKQHDTQACAVGCHQHMDPFGYAFENYDGIGQWRTTDNNLPVDATSTILVDNQSASVDGAVQMAPVLASSSTLQQCFTAQWLTYALGRDVTADDAPSAQAAHTAFAASSFKITTLLAGLASSRTFRFRTPSPGEVLP